MLLDNGLQIPPMIRRLVGIQHHGKHFLTTNMPLQGNEEFHLPSAPVNELLKF